MGTKLSKTGLDLVKKNEIERKKQFGRERASFAGISQGVSVSTGIGSRTGGNAIPNTSALPITGGQLIGGLAFFPKTIDIVSDTIDLKNVTGSGNVTANTSNVNLIGTNDSGGSQADDLKTINGNFAEGHMLILKAVVNAITIKDGIGNILTPGNTDYVIAGDEGVFLIYDEVGGDRWIVLGVEGGSGGGDNMGDHTATQALKMEGNAIFFDTGLIHSIISGTKVMSYIVDDSTGGSHKFFVDDLTTPKFQITETTINVVDNNIINTGDIEVGSGVHQIGTTSAPYNQMFSKFFVPKTATVITNRYALAKIGNTTYVNYDSTNADAGFSVYEEGLESFRFYNPSSTVNEFHIGSSAAFTSGEEYAIQMGEAVNSSARIYFIEGSGNDLILDRDGAGTTQGVQIRGNGLTLARFLSNRLLLSQPLDMNSKDIQKVVKITGDGAGGASTGVIGELISSDGGFNYFVRSAIQWDSDAAVQITFGSGGIDILTNGSTDHIDIKATGTSSHVNLQATGTMEIRADASTGINFLAGGALRFTIQDNFLVSTVPLAMGGQAISNCGAIEINGALNHDGTTVGFYGVTPQTRQNIAPATGTLANVIGVVNSLVAILNANGLVNQV